MVLSRTGLVLTLVRTVFLRYDKLVLDSVVYGFGLWLCFKTVVCVLTSLLRLVSLLLDTCLMGLAQHEIKLK